MIEPFHSLPAQMWVPAVATFLTNFAFGIVTTCAPTMVGDLWLNPTHAAGCLCGCSWAGKSLCCVGVLC